MKPDSGAVIPYRPDIDGLRALAVAAVFFYHAGISAISGGYVGVDVFFVISGYLIGQQLWGQLRRGEFSWLRFIERRARRILPQLLLVLVASVGLAVWWMSPREQRDYLASFLAALRVASNIHFSREADYFDPEAEGKPLLHLWSISLEEQFYLLLPPILMAAYRLGCQGRVLHGLIAMAVLGGLVLSVARQASAPSEVFFLIQYRFWELLAGVWLALCAPSALRLADRWRWVAPVAQATGIFLIAWSATTYTEWGPYPGLPALVPVAAAGLLVTFGGAPTPIRAVLASRVLVWLGLISYGVYLWHQPLLVLLRAFGSLSAHPAGVGGVLIASLALAHMAWRWLEQPARDRGRVPGKVFWPLTIGAYAGASLLGVWLQRAPDAVQGEAARAMEAAEGRLQWNLGLHETCDPAKGLASQCQTSAAPEVLLFGDSYAMHLVPGILASQPDVKLAQLTSSACGPVFDYAPVEGRILSRQWAEGCLAFLAAVQQYLDRTPSIRVAILASPYFQYTTPGVRFLTSSGELAFSFERSLERYRATLAEFDRRGIATVTVSPPPIARFNVGRCLVRSEALSFPAQWCDVNPGALQWRHAGALRFLEEIGKTHPVLRLDQLMCDDGRCPASRDGVFFWRDQGHLSIEGSRAVGLAYGLHDRLLQAAQGLPRAGP